MPPLPSWWLSRFVPGVWLMIGALACSRDRSAPARTQAVSASALASATPSVSAAGLAASAPGPAQADSAGAPAASSASAGAAQGTGPNLAKAVLDQAKGKQALAAYRGFLKAICRTDKGGNRSGGKIEAAERLGLKGADAMSFCFEPNAAGKALASGSFLQDGADEVLLQARSGISAGSSEVLLVMRADGSSYRFVRYLQLGSTFTVPARIIRAGATDIVLLCNNHGSQGVYPGECGFRDLSTFGPEVWEESGNTTEDDLRLLSLTNCGPSGSITLGKVTQIEDRIEVRLSVARFVLKPRDADEHGDHCSSEVPGSRSSKEFTMRYAYDGKRFKLETPVPSEAKELLDREW